MATEPVLPDLLRRFVLWADEEIEQVEEEPDGLAVGTTGLRHFVGGSEVDDWRIGRADWVADVLVAVRDDIVVSGQPERFAFVVPVEGEVVHLNDPAALAALGAHLPQRLAPAAYAEVLVAFHRYSSALATVLHETDDLRRLAGRPDLPAVEPLRMDSSADGVRLTFTAAERYRRPFTGTLVDLSEWRVEVPPGSPAQWVIRPVAEGLRLDSPAGLVS